MRSRVKFSYRGMLRQMLSREEYENATKSYDVFGNIAIIDSSGNAAKKIAKAVMLANKNVETVLRKKGAVEGEYRIRAFGYVLGKKNYLVKYRENGAVFEFDLRKTFFSSRLAYERQRIVQQVGDKENVIVMFAGVGPFAIEIAKHHRNCKVIAIELNKNAYAYMLKNIKANKTVNVVPELGDVKKVARKYAGFADRIIMPLPKDTYRFLPEVLEVAGKRCIVHYYAFGKIEDAFSTHTAKLRNFFVDKKRSFRVLGKRVVRPYSAREIEIVLDFVIRRG